MILVKIPFLNGLGKTYGCEKAPEEIIKALEEIFSSESGKKIDFSVQDINIDSSNIEDSSKKIQGESRKFFEKDEKVVFIGGDHSLSYSLAREFSKKNRHHQQAQNHGEKYRMKKSPMAQKITVTYPKIKANHIRVRNQRTTNSQ